MTVTGCRQARRQRSAQETFINQGLQPSKNGWIFQLLDIVNSSYSLGFFLFVLAQFIHGLFQSTGGPVNTSIMGNWFPKKGRGLIFGLWTCHQYVGDIVSGCATAAIINAGFAWQWALVLPGVLNGLWGVVNFMFLPNKPSEVGLEPEEKVPAPPHRHQR